MAFEDVKPSAAGISISNHPNKPIVARVLSKQTQKSKFGNTQNVWTLRTEEGKVFNVYGFAALDARLRNVPLGSLCRITYLGKKQNKDGNNTHDVSVQVDKDAGVVPLPDQEKENAGQSEEIPF